MLRKVFNWIKDLFSFNVKQEILDDLRAHNKNKEWKEQLGRRTIKLTIAKVRPRNKLRIKRKHNGKNAG